MGVTICDLEQEIAIRSLTVFFVKHRISPPDLFNATFRFFKCAANDSPPSIKFGNLIGNTIGTAGVGTRREIFPQNLNLYQGK